MTSSVGNKCYEVHILALLTSEESVYGFDYHLDDVDILPFIESTDVVSLGYLAFMENEVDGSSVVFDEEPVSHVLALAIYRQRFAMAYIVDEKRYELLGELVGTIVVRTVGHYYWHSVGIVEGSYEVVARSF